MSQVLLELTFSDFKTISMSPSPKSLTIPALSWAASDIVITFAPLVSPNIIFKPWYSSVASTFPTTSPVSTLYAIEADCAIKACSIVSFS